MRYAVLMLALLFLCGRVSAEEGLPEFKLDRLRVSGLRLAAPGVEIPPLSKPVPYGPPGTGYGPGPEAGPETYPLYRPYRRGFITLPGGFMRLRLGQGGEHGTDNIRFTGRTKIKIYGKKGRAEVEFPKVEFQDALPGDEAFLFVRLSGAELPPELSWAEVICAGGRYLGYKGASFRLPENSGDFTLTETLAVGRRKQLIAATHPWLAGPAEERRLDGLCSRQFRRKMRDCTASTLPERAGPFRFAYDAAGNVLEITWGTE